MQPVFCFLEDNRLRAVDHAVGYFGTAIGGQAVHVDSRLFREAHAAIVADPIFVFVVAVEAGELVFISLRMRSITLRSWPDSEGMAIKSRRKRTIAFSYFRAWAR